MFDIEYEGLETFDDDSIHFELLGVSESNHSPVSSSKGWVIVQMPTVDSEGVLPGIVQVLASRPAVSADWDEVCEVDIPLPTGRFVLVAGNNPMDRAEVILPVGWYRARVMYRGIEAFGEINPRDSAMSIELWPSPSPLPDAELKRSAAVTRVMNWPDPDR